jgi:hypothetical protein
MSSGEPANKSPGGSAPVALGAIVIGRMERKLVSICIVGPSSIGRENRPSATFKKFRAISYRTPLTQTYVYTFCRRPAQSVSKART